MNSHELQTFSMPYATASLPGIGGEIKKYDEDFVVEEIPLYEASGEGTHTYLTIEKRGLTTAGAIENLARALGRKSRDFGYAGMKDAHAVTRQTISIEHVAPEAIDAIKPGRVRILAIAQHTNKIKLGHLTGNRFIIRIRGAQQDAMDRARAIIDALVKRGVPNHFGPQRFGVRGDNTDVGRAVLQGDFAEAIAVMLGRPISSDRDDVRKARELFDAGDLAAAAQSWPTSMRGNSRLCKALQQSPDNPAKAWRSVDHSLRKFYVFAYQSDLFNRVLASRMDSRDQLLTGDLAWKHANGACFLVEDAEVEQLRCDSFEISPTGPLFGRKMKEGSGQPAQIESDVLAESGLSREEIRAQDGVKLDGARRPLRVPVTDADVSDGSDEHGPYVELSFSLPKGAYATNVTREVCKSVG